MEFLFSFLIGLFIMCILGVTYNFGLSYGNYRNLKKKYNEAPINIFFPTLHFLLFTVVIGVILILI